VPAGSPATFSVRASGTAPLRYQWRRNGVEDGGHAYGDRFNGRTYGWNIDNTAQMRDCNSTLSPDQRYDTLAYLQRPANPDAFWEIAVPNGTYVVHAVAGDAAYFNITYRIAIEGVVVVDGTSNSATRWIEGTSTVTVSDGRLTLRSGAGATAKQDLLRRDHAPIACRVQADGDSGSVQRGRAGASALGGIDETGQPIDRNRHCQ
jgi:hypothetical protein